MSRTVSLGLDTLPLAATYGIPWRIAPARVDAEA